METIAPCPLLSLFECFSHGSLLLPGGPCNIADTFKIGLKLWAESIFCGLSFTYLPFCQVSSPHNCQICSFFVSPWIEPVDSNPFTDTRQQSFEAWKCCFRHPYITLTLFWKWYFKNPFMSFKQYFKIFTKFAKKVKRICYISFTKFWNNIKYEKCIWSWIHLKKTL